MALASENQPAPNAEKASFHPGIDLSESTQMLASPTSKTQKKKRKGFSMCGLNCMGAKQTKAEVMEIDETVQPNRPSADLTQPLASTPEAAPKRDVQTIVESPPVPQRKYSSSGSGSVKEETESVIPDKTLPSRRPSQDATSSAARSSIVKDFRTPTENDQNDDAHSFSIKDSASNPISAKPITTYQFLNETQSNVAHKPQSMQPEQSVNTTFSTFGDICPANTTPQSAKLTEINQNSLESVNQNVRMSLNSLTYEKDSESVDGGAQSSPPPPSQRRDSSTTSSCPSGGKTPITLHSGIPLPRNPTKAMVGAAHQSSYHSEENLESKILNHTLEATPTVPVENPNPSSVLFEPLKTEPSEIFSSSPLPIIPIDQNGTFRTPTMSSQSSLPASPSTALTPPSQKRRTSGLMGPKVVVNKPGINVYKGRNAPLFSSSSSSPGKTGPIEGESQKYRSTASANCASLVNQKTDVLPSSLSTTLAPSTPTTSPVSVSPKPSNIRPPSVTVEGFPSVHNRPSGSSIPTRSSLGNRDGNHDSSPSTVPAVRSIPPPTTGIRMPSRLPRQTAAK